MPGQQPDDEQNGQQTAPPGGQHTAPAPGPCPSWIRPSGPGPHGRIADGGSPETRRAVRPARRTRHRAATRYRAHSPPARRGRRRRDVHSHDERRGPDHGGHLVPLLRSPPPHRLSDRRKAHRPHCRRSGPGRRATQRPRSRARVRAGRHRRPRGREDGDPCADTGAGRSREPQVSAEGPAPGVGLPPGVRTPDFLPLGTRGGVGQLPMLDGTAAQAPLETVIQRKGAGLFTARFSERFNRS
jgi:hypothetical protein